MITKNHKWRSGGFPQLCERCGILRERRTLKYVTKIVYTNINKTTPKRPNCVFIKKTIKL